MDDDLSELDYDNQLLKNANRYIIIDLLDSLYIEDENLITNEEIKYKIEKTELTLDMDKFRDLCIFVLNKLINDEKYEIPKKIDETLRYFEHINIDEFINTCKVMHIKQFIQELYENYQIRYNSLPRLLDCVSNNNYLISDEVSMHKYNIINFINRITELESKEEHYNIEISEYSFDLKVELVLFSIGLERILEIINIKIILNETKNEITKEVFQIMLDYYGYINDETKIIKSIDIKSFIRDISNDIMYREEKLHNIKENHQLRFERYTDFYM